LVGFLTEGVKLFIIYQAADKAEGATCVDALGQERLGQLEVHLVDANFTPFSNSLYLQEMRNMDWVITNSLRLTSLATSLRPTCLVVARNHSFPLFGQQPVRC
jgi:hypothetical protein